MDFPDRCTDNFHGQWCKELIGYEHLYGDLSRVWQDSEYSKSSLEDWHLKLLSFVIINIVSGRAYYQKPSTGSNADIFGYRPHHFSSDEKHALNAIWEHQQDFRELYSRKSNEPMTKALNMDLPKYLALCVLRLADEHLAPKRVSASRLLQIVADNTNTTVEDLRGKKKIRNLARARAIFCYVAYDNGQSGRSLPAIGRSLDRDHTTVLHGVRTVRDFLEIDRDSSREMQQCMSTLREHGHIDQLPIHRLFNKFVNWSVAEQRKKPRGMHPSG